MSRHDNTAVDANIVDEAGEEGAGSVIAPDANVQTASENLQDTLDVLCHYDVIDTKRSE
jgi:hypothetical protein